MQYDSGLQNRIYLLKTFDATYNLFECKECEFKVEFVSDFYAHIEFGHEEDFDDGN